jgi:hypothetical protein
MMPDEIDDTFGLTFKQVLQSNHPYETTPQLSTLHPYNVTPEFSCLDVIHDTIEQLARNVSGSSGLGGVGSQDVSHCRTEMQVQRSYMCWHHSPTGWPTRSHHGLPIERYGQGNCWRWKRCQEYG